MLMYLCRNRLGLYESTNLSVRELIEDLGGICEVTHSNRYGTLITESTIKEREFPAKLGVETS
jgi:hypothetical protein